jgi:hypothetical protein
MPAIVHVIWIGLAVSLVLARLVGHAAKRLKGGGR